MSGLWVKKPGLHFQYHSISCDLKQSKAKQNKAKQSKQSKAKQSKAKQSKAKQSKAKKRKEKKRKEKKREKRKKKCRTARSGPRAVAAGSRRPWRKRGQVRRQQQPHSPVAPEPLSPPTTSVPGASLSKLCPSPVKTLVKADPSRGVEHFLETICKRCLVLCSTRKKENPPGEIFG